MDRRSHIMLFFVTMILLPKNIMRVKGKNLSQDEYLKMNAYLESLNKPAVMSIPSEFGDIYDCVDIYKQPAFDHPALKNHKIQMKPSSYPKGIPKNNTKSRIGSIGLKGGGCPKGTVPIKRAQIQDLLIAKSLRNFRVEDDYDSGDEKLGYAALKAWPGEYYGARAFMNVWQPTVNTSGIYSLSQMWLSSGLSKQNTIEVGWMVYPKEFGSQTRLFVHWTADDYNETGCYNTLCPGFVQLNQFIPVDTPLVELSKYNGQQHEIQIDIFKDPRSGNWYLSKDELTIGYWPRSIFDSLNIKATRVEWGGETRTCKSCRYPPMGSGHFPEEGYGKAAYIRGLQVIDDNMRMTLKDVEDFITHAPTPDCYRVQHEPKGRGKLTDNHLLFGGPGGALCP